MFIFVIDGLFIQLSLDTKDKLVEYLLNVI